MLKRLRKTIQDAGNSPNKNNANDAETPEKSNPSQEASGFICPMCMSGFRSPDELQLHFSSTHAETNNVAPSKESLPTVDEKKEVNPQVFNVETLHANNHVTTESKQEAGQSMLHTNSSTLHENQNPVPVLKQANNAALEEQLEVMKSQIDISIRTNEDLAREKDEISQKLAKKSQEYARLQALLDETEGQKQSQIEINQNQVTELQKAAAWISDLESQLIERPGADDVLVLKKELISVQTLMDQLTLESEKKKEQIENQCKDLKRDYEELQKSHGNLKEDYDTLLAKYADSNLHSKEAQSNMMQNFTQKIEDLEVELKNSLASLSKEKEYSSGLQDENTSLKKELTEGKVQSQELNSSFVKISEEMAEKQIKTLELERKIDDLECSKNALHNQLQDVQQKYETTLQKNDDSELERNTKIHSLSRQCNDLSNELTDAKNELSIVKSHYDLLQNDHEKLKDVLKKQEMEANRISQRHELEVSEIQSLLYQANAKNVEYEKQLDELTEESNVIRQQVQNDRSSAHVKIMEKEKLIVQMEASADNIKEELDQCKNQLRETLSKLEKEKSLTDDLKNKVQVLSSEELLQVKKLDALEQSLTEMKGKLSVAESEKETAQQEVSRLQQERNDLHQKIEVDEGNAAFVAQLIEENKTLRSRLEESGDRIKEQLIQYQTLEKEHQNSATEYVANDQKQADTIAMLNATINELKVTVDQYNENEIESRNDLLEKKQIIVQLKEECSEQKLNFEGEISNLNCFIKEKTRECEKLSNSIESIKALHNAAWQEAEQSKKNFQKRFDQLQGDILTGQVQVGELEKCLREKTDSLATEKANHESSKKKYEEEVVSMKYQHEEEVALLKSSLRLSKEEHTATKSKLEVSLHDNSELNRQLRERTTQLELLEKQSCEKDTLIHSLTENAEDYKLKLSESQQVLDEKEKDWATQKKELEQKNSESLQGMKNSHDAEIERLNTAASKANEKRMSEIDSLQKSLDQANHLVKSESDKKAQLEKEMDENKITLENLQESFELSKKTFLSQIEQNSKEIESLEAVMKTLRDENETKSKEIAAKNELCKSDLNLIKTLENDLQMAEKKLKQTLDELDVTSNDLQKSQQEYSNLSLELSVAQEMTENTKTELEDAKKNADDTKTSLDKSNEMIGSLNIRIEDLGEKLEESQKVLKENEDETKRLLLELNEKEKTWTETEQTLQSKIQELESESEKIRKELNQHMQDHQKEKKLWDEKEQQFHQDESDWTDERERHQQTEETLKAAQQILMNSKMELQKQLEESHKIIEEEKNNLNHVQELNNEEKRKIITELDSAKEELEISVQDHEKTKVESQKLVARLQLEIGTLRDNLDSVRGEWQSSIQQAETRDAENEELKGKIVVLQATVQNNSDEKRVLFERCIRAEQSVEQMKSVEVQIKRRLDDAQAAMHELGRENQAMQVKHTSVLSRQWADDRHVPECTSCQRQFSITIRKHHCRHCGLIFCSDCSSKTMQLAASKKPARVCEKCYDDLLVVQ